jgi:hypothetical protein
LLGSFISLARSLRFWHAEVRRFFIHFPGSVPSRPINHLVPQPVSDNLKGGLLDERLHRSSAPYEESCAQVGRDDYWERARRECRAFINQLRRVFGPEPEGARLSIKSNPHDFGTYLSVICSYESDNETAVDYAFRCEGEGPGEWDEEAKRELAERQVR